jgi:S-adenosylmethionine:tRNA ribosyltransferase-isomerase
MASDFDIAAYQYHLPEQQIAQFPAKQRDQSRLLALDCRENSTQDLRFSDILRFLEPGDLLVVNNTEVFPARLEGSKETGGKIEFFLLEYPDFSENNYFKRASLQNNEEANWFCIEATGLLKSSKKPQTGSRIAFGSDLEGEVIETLPGGKINMKLCFNCRDGIAPQDILSASGRIPLPPYISRTNGDHESDRERYQTLFASSMGAIAAPTAGLHFSESLLRKLQEKNIGIAPITLHVGYGTFAPVRVSDIRKHQIHEEFVEVSAATAELINYTRSNGNRVWAVGTTTVRSMEFAANDNGFVKPTSGWCGLYIYPGYKFKVVNSLITNFHLPGSSLLFLVAALVGRSKILQAYLEAIKLGYRFYSYGDAMAIIT